MRAKGPVRQWGMCLIAVAWQAHPRFRLVLAANRDEFHARPAAAAAPWPDAPQVLGGRDLKQDGSWLAVSTAGRLAAVTNVRRMLPPNPRAPSRGQLVAGFVRGKASAAAFAQALAPEAMRYAGFNLLLHDGQGLYYADNHPEFECRAVSPGVHVLSNDQLDTPWPKSRRLHRALDAWLAAGDDAPDALFAALADRVRASDAELPDTGVGLETERMLSPPFICTPTYGTRCSTVVQVADDHILFTERRFDARGEPLGETRQRLERVDRPKGN